MSAINIKETTSEPAWNCQMLIDQGLSISYKIVLQLTLSGLEIKIPNASIKEEDQGILQSKFRFHPTVAYWKKKIEWKNEISIVQWSEPTVLILFDQSYNKLVGIQFKNYEDVLSFGVQIHGKQLTLLPWDEYEIAQRIGATLWHHYHKTFEKAKHPWPIYMQNKAFLIDHNTLIEHSKRKERMFIELVVQVRLKYKHLKKQLENKLKVII